tara:strand:+ start:333 stop:1022 length:690 start_codon:yes stop_codon:yes gene_type:complete
MNRRDSIKAIVISSIASGLILEGCIQGEKEVIYENVWKYKYGRTPEELQRDLKILNQVFFSKEELNLIRIVSNLIVPPTEQGTIEQAEVPEFIEFIVKDTPSYQKILKDGLVWLNETSTKNFEKKFINCSIEEQKSILDKVAFPKIEKSEEEIFFSNMKNLVITGYFSSEVGINDLGYKGNQPNFWDGVPDDIMRDHGFSYEKDWKYNFVDPMTRNEIAKWDENGNLIT